MFTWARIPFVRITLFFIVGIVLGLRLPSYPLFIAGLLIISITFLSILQYYKTRLFIRYNALYGFMISVIFLQLGYLAICWHIWANHNNSIAQFTEINAYRAEVRSSPEVKENSYKLLLQIEEVRQDSTWFEADGKILLYLQKSKILPDFGDRLLILGEPQEVAPPRNPHEFDYKNFLANRGIYHSQWVDSANWLIVAPAAGFDIKRYANQVRGELERILANAITDGKVVGVLKALVLGEKEDLDSETREVFARAGVMHVLAVSGLHVGIVYLILILLMKPLAGKFDIPWVESAIIILILWFYAFITGLPPSVLRAVTMFSILELGRRLDRSASPFNSLALSAFLLLWINPYLITQVGFQLSYVAVTGILLLYKPIFNLYSPHNRIIGFFWQIIAVSLAAQIATAPLAIYYFSQFPTYFLLANLIVIPVVTVLVWGGIMLLSFGLVSQSLSEIIGQGLEFLVQSLESTLYWITTLPFATIEKISFDLAELLLIYAFISLLTAIIVSGVKRSLQYLLLIVLMVFLGRSVGLTYTNKLNKQVIFYSLDKGHWAIDLIQNGEYTMIADSALEAGMLSYSIQPNRIKSRWQASEVEIATKQVVGLGLVLVWQGKAILIAEGCAHDLPQLAEFDYVLQPRHPRFKECYSDQNLLIKLVGEDKFHGYDLHNQAFIAPL